jgi:hypothetical protein
MKTTKLRLEFVDGESNPPVVSFECDIETSGEWRKIDWNAKAADLMAFAEKHSLCTE